MGSKSGAVDLELTPPKSTTLHSRASYRVKLGGPVQYSQSECEESPTGARPLCTVGKLKFLAVVVLQRRKSALSSTPMHVPQKPKTHVWRVTITFSPRDARSRNSLNRCRASRALISTVLMAPPRSRVQYWRSPENRAVKLTTAPFGRPCRRHDPFRMVAGSALTWLNSRTDYTVVVSCLPTHRRMGNSP